MLVVDVMREDHRHGLVTQLGHLWPEFEEISDTLESYLSEVTDRVVSQVIHQDSSEAEVVDDPSQLPGRTAPPPPPRETSVTEANSKPPKARDSDTQDNASDVASTAKNRKKRKRKKNKKRR